MPVCGGERDDMTKISYLNCRHKPAVKYMRTLRKRRILNNQCSRCGRERECEPGYLLCLKCRDYIASWRISNTSL